MTEREAVRGTVSAEGPIFSHVAEGVWALIAHDNTTIDMTTQQAIRLGLITPEHDDTPSA